MHSSKLQKNLSLALDTFGARGEPVTKREIVEFVDRLSQDEHWSLPDWRDARQRYFTEAVTAQMNAPISQDHIDRLMPHVPREYLPMLFGLSSWICVSPEAGPNSKHVMSLMATADHWKANATLKDNIAERTAARADQSKDAFRFLTEKGLTRLSDLGTRIAA